MNRRTFAYHVMGTAGALVAGQRLAAAAEPTQGIYFGTYTDDPSDSLGIYQASFDAATGLLGAPELVVAVPNPSYLALHPNGKYVYAVGEAEGKVASFAVQEDGKLKLLNRISAKGDGPCHISIDKTGKVVVLANYDSGSVVSFLVQEDGSLSQAVNFHQHHGHSVNPDRQEGPHAHCANFSPDNRFVLVCDLGLDKVFTYKLEAETGILTPVGFVRLPRGSGPRHVAFSQSGKHVLVNAEMLLTETVFEYDSETGLLKPLETLSVLPKGVHFSDEYSTAETCFHPNGKWVYVSVRTHDTLTRFSFDDATGKLTFEASTSCGGKIPRDFNIDPSGRWLIAAHQDSGNVVVFEIDPATGDLKPTGKEQHISGGVCVKFKVQA